MGDAPATVGRFTVAPLPDGTGVAIVLEASADARPASFVVPAPLLQSFIAQLVEAANRAAYLRQPQRRH